MTDGVAASEAPPTLFGHPRGLAVLFFAEMWERFSFYGMRGLLTLYLTKHWLFSDEIATGIYAGYASMVYLMPVLGGLIADRYLGFQRAVIIGAVLLCLGHLGMAFEGHPAFYEGDVLVRDTTALQVLYLSLALIIVGVGLLKPSISSIVGALYAENDARRDGGFTIFYMGINVGAVLAALTCGYLGETYGWAYGFGLAGLGMLVGLATFLRGRKWLGSAGLEPVSEEGGTEAAQQPKAVLAIGIVATIGVSWLLMQNQAWVGGLLSVASVIAVVGVLSYMFVACDRDERKSMGLLLFLTAYSVIFWALFEQAGSSMTLFADRIVDREMLGISFTASQLQFFNPGFIILLAPLFAMLWVWLGSKGWEPSGAAKFGLGTLQAGLGFFLLVWGIQNAEDGAQVVMWWLAGAYLLHTTGELCLSPVGLSLVTKLAVGKVVGLMMGVWFLASSVAHYVAGIIAAAASVSSASTETVVATSAAMAIYEEAFYVVGVVGVGAGVALLLVTPLLNRCLEK